MEYSFIKEGWIPNYVSFKENYLQRCGNVEDMFLTYLERFVKPFKKENTIYFLFDFGDKSIEVASKRLENLLYELKDTEGNRNSEIEVIPTELAEFLSYFNLIEKTKKGYFMIEDSVAKLGDASLASLLGHVLIEKHFPVKKAI